MNESPHKELPLNTDLLLRVAPVMAAIRAYHQHTTVGLDKIPKSGVMLAVNHSLASYDIGLLAASIYEYTNRLPRALIDRLFFKVPGLGQLMEAIGNREGTRDNAEKMLRDGEILVLAPGGMREALRPSAEKYKVKWDRRKGFAKLSIETGTPIILAACPAADDLYDIAPSYLTAWAYKTFKVPLFFAKGLFFSPIPKPVKLTHYLSDPILPPEMATDPDIKKDQIDKFHHELVEKMEKLMEESAKFIVTGRPQ
jgi:1-acyl-sn-glycerol-3-phosphate acyltransferase